MARVCGASSPAARAGHCRLTDSSSSAYVHAIGARDHHGWPRVGFWQCALNGTLLHLSRYSAEESSVDTPLGARNLGSARESGRLATGRMTGVVKTSSPDPSPRAYVVLDTCGEAGVAGVAGAAATTGVFGLLAIRRTRFTMFQPASKGSSPSRAVSTNTSST